MKFMKLLVDKPRHTLSVRLDFQPALCNHIKKVYEF